jgi:N-acetylglutamate synthase-like GNAT family acetyltransferase
MEMKSQSMLIRQADSSDHSMLTHLIRSAFLTAAERFGLNSENCPTHPSNCTDEWIRRDYAKGMIYYILENDGVPSGCVALEQANPRVCYLEGLAVLPQQRRKGFGKALVDCVLTKSKDLGVNNVDIGIIADDIELKEWYKKIGFNEGETRRISHLPFAVTFMSYELASMERGLRDVC